MSREGIVAQYVAAGADPAYMESLLDGARDAYGKAFGEAEARLQADVDAGVYDLNTAKSLFESEVSAAQASIEATIQSAVGMHLYHLDEEARKEEEAGSVLSQGVKAFGLASKILSPISSGLAYVHRELVLDDFTDDEFERIASVLPPSINGMGYEDFKPLRLTGLGMGESIRSAFNETFAGESVTGGLYSVAMGELETSSISPFQATQALQALEESRKTAPSSRKVASGFLAGVGTIAGFGAHMTGLRGTAKVLSTAAKKAKLVRGGARPGPAALLNKTPALIRKAGGEAAEFALATGAAVETGQLTGADLAESAKTGALFGTSGFAGQKLGAMVPRIGGTSVGERLVRGGTTGATVAGLHTAHGGGDWADWAGEALLFGLAGAMGKPSRPDVEGAKQKLRVSTRPGPVELLRGKRERVPEPKKPEIEVQRADAASFQQTMGEKHGALTQKRQETGYTDPSKVAKKDQREVRTRVLLEEMQKQEGPVTATELAAAVNKRLGTEKEPAPVSRQQVTAAINQIGRDAADKDYKVFDDKRKVDKGKPKKIYQLLSNEEFVAAETARNKRIAESTKRVQKKPGGKLAEQIKKDK